MNWTSHIAQPTTRTTLNALKAVLESGGVERMDVAVAYVTNGGAYDFVKAAADALGESWNDIPKRWITSFDYCRTEPFALECLKGAPNSAVRIYDAAFCLNHGGAPRVPFHPKAFLVKTEQRDFVIAGSGNMSRSGLSRGVEAGLIVSVSRVSPATSAAAALDALHAWFAGAWSKSTPLTDPLIAQYCKIFEAKENLKGPAPTEDDLASTDTGRRSLSSKDLQKLRVCRHLWIDSGNITRNRGPGVPGNQLMLKRLSRVFFGFVAAAVPENTHIGDVEIRFNGGPKANYSLTYSDNKMDKLGLPIPGVAGPVAYDNSCLLFTQVGPTSFELTIGSRQTRARWLRASVAIEGYFKMTSGREWGVF